MLTKVELYSTQPGVAMLPLNFVDVDRDQIQLRDIEGLGPVKADILSTPYADDGELYQGSSKGKRNIVFKFGLNPVGTDQRMSTLRHMLYKYFQTQSRVALGFVSDDMPTVDISGYVESFDPNIFSKDPEIQVSVICPRPDFVSRDLTTRTGTIYPTTTMDIEYAGTVETGFEMSLDMRSVLNGVIDVYDIRLARSGETHQRFYTALHGSSSSWYYYLSTLKGLKRAEYRPEGLNVIKHMASWAVWPLLRPGTNVLTTSLDNNPSDGTTRNWTMTYRNRYGGL